MKKVTLVVIGLSTLCAFGAETNIFNPGTADPAEVAKTWTGNPKYGPWGKVNATGSKDGKTCIEYTFGKGWVRIQGGGLTEVDPSAVYKIKVALKGKKDTALRIGICSFDANKKFIDTLHNARPSDPIYTLAADAKKGDKTITLNASVSYLYNWGVAFNAKKDGSDIPNRDVARLLYSPKKVTGSTLTFARPLSADYAKGTTVRLQRWQDLACRDVKLTGDWKEFSFSTQGNRALAPYTKYITIFLQSGFKEPETILINAPSIEKVSAK